MSEDELDLEAFLGWFEFGCWTALVIAPILRLINGPAVSRNQFVVQIGLISFATVIIFTLRVRRVLKRRQPHKDCIER